MKKSLTFLIYFLFATHAQAQMPYIEEMRALGAISGQGLACGSTKYDTFELLARAILLTKAPSDKLRTDAIYAYSEEKANAYISKEMDGFYECSSINRRFDNQEIFKAVLYGDGTIKMPDGQILTPRQPYDARMIYKENANSRKEAKAIYNGREAKIIKVDVKDDTLASMQYPKTRQPQINMPNTIGHISRSR
ncbi:MAG: hypothetical protein IJW72_00825 [Alphaproteobacteria bacterium]|nr:hypothetical protein [Alphaproteobacteria bacterium]MBQ7284783.1 hypothetical protein [Alphaproteobacteria bacterium]